MNNEEIKNGAKVLLCGVNVMKAEQYRPNFFSGFEQEQNNFDNTQKLLNIEWVKSFSNHDNFHRFSLSRDENKYGGKPQHSLMAEYNNGFEWWVVAMIRDENISGIDDIPEWEAKYKDKS
jgi:hypothetical protein